MMDLKTAVDLRHSRRAYIPETLPLDTACKLHDYVTELNRIPGVNIHFLTNNSDAFDGILKSYGFFSGVKNYFVVVRNINNPNSTVKAGYYGEKLVLYCTTLGLNTCWVSATFDRKSCPVDIAENEEICAAIPVGHSPRRKSISENLLEAVYHPRSKRLNEMYIAEKTPPPEWFLRGIAAVVKAPSAYNRQPAKFIYHADGTVGVELRQTDKSGSIDLGIAGLHFEIGSGRKLILFSA
ncbi:MAG: nitroreductase [Ruminococcus sp.]|jgi:nitroreductase|nr:nitroreductase [Ruminococcus sp.]